LKADPTQELRVLLTLNEPLQFLRRLVPVHASTISD
jgi:hypothetical protein